MRVLAFALVLAAASAAHAEPFVELGGGLALPVANDNYTNAVDPGPKVVVRLGGGGPSVGGLFSIDWTPLAADNSFVSFNRFRFLGHVQIHHPLSPRAELAFRFGAGIDLLHEHTSVTIAGVQFDGSDSDIGLALEAAGGAWFAVGASGSTRVGVELGLPISYHSSNGNPNNPNDPNNAKFDYTSVDIDILGGVRLSL